MSTGKGKEFRALEGALGGGPFVENNLAETLDGVVDMVFFNYQNKSAAEGIFFEWFKPEPTINPSPNKTPVLQRVAPLFETIYFPPLSVVFRHDHHVYTCRAPVVHLCVFIHAIASP